MPSETRTHGWRRVARHIGVGPTLIVAGAVFLALALAANRPARAGSTVCEDISGDHVITGESRYTTNSGTDTCYANAYWDNGDELDLPWRGIAGGANSTSASLTFKNYNYTRDAVTDDCTNVTFYNTHQDSATMAAGSEPNCLDGSIEIHYNDMIINSCSNSGCTGDSCLLYAGKALGPANHAYRAYWYTEIDVATASGCNASRDYGCYVVKSQSNCDLLNF